GSPRAPKVKVNNEKIARRHLNAFLLQTFFHEVVNAGSANQTGMLQKALGSTMDFFVGTADASFPQFERWVEDRVLNDSGDLVPMIRAWLPESLTGDPDGWVRQT